MSGEPFDQLALFDDEPDDEVLCTSCGTVVQALDGRGEMYMVLDDIWRAAVPDELDEVPVYLCVGCLEERLGRRLTSDDFTDAPLNAIALVTSTDRLVDRLTTPELSPAVRCSIQALDAYLRRT